MCPSVSDVRSGQGSRSPVLSRPHWFSAAPRGQPARPAPPPPRTRAHSQPPQRPGSCRRQECDRLRTAGTGTRGCPTAPGRGAHGTRGRGGRPAFALGALGVPAAPSRDPSCGRAHQAPPAAAAAQRLRGAGDPSWAGGCQPSSPATRRHGRRRPDAGQARGACSRPAPGPQGALLSAQSGERPLPTPGPPADAKAPTPGPARAAGQAASAMGAPGGAGQREAE